MTGNFPGLHVSWLHMSGCMCPGVCVRGCMCPGVYVRGCMCPWLHVTDLNK